MKSFKKKLQQLVYSFSTEDRYADYDEEAANPDVAAGVERSITESNHGSEIQLADYVDAANPNGNEGISETLLAWRHIDTWASEHNPDLAATLSDPCTRHDINNAEKDLNIIFPASVRASLRLHDGQEDLESMTGTGGLFFGLQLMALDEIVQMTRTWRNVADNLDRKNQELQIKLNQHQELNGTSVDLPNQKQKGYGKLENQDYKGMDPNLQRNISQNYKKQFKLPDIPNQHSIPPLAIQQVYANSGWIPLATDNAGNHIGIDLAPGPKGKYGQVILFGREFDTKFVVANNWGDFLLSFANDLELGNWLLIDEGNDQFAGEGELVFRDKQSNGPVRDYLEVLVMRCRMKWSSLSEKKLPEEPRAPSPSQESQNTVEAAQLQETSFTADEKLVESQNDSTAVDNNTQEATDLGSVDSTVEPTATPEANDERTEIQIPKEAIPETPELLTVTDEAQNETSSKAESTQTQEKKPKKKSKKKSQKSQKDDDKETDMKEDVSGQAATDSVGSKEKESREANSVDGLKDAFENVAL
ncbi:unnamed protein product [Kluyveromyces dobzhanskii CBS 2104]|uniref:WGS project CCBQ000000000 data, contig 00046 n=1 Tax=Kluyveromyces dobzhanskii CBS 2104 TaxID=1427455 RepID=A0A0A8L7F1_9SACH|nr:unnamed protein product [Kluyveromyces dobzhanskii CBS 2104]